MEDKLQSPIFKSLMTGVFVALSYLISDLFLITTIILPILNSKWHVTVSVAIYTGLLNALFLFLLSFRTNINVDVCDKKDESYNVTIDERPRNIALKIKISGNVKNIKETVSIVFPEWIDLTVAADPSIKLASGKTNEYIIALSEKEISFTFSVSVNPSYQSVTRKNSITTKITGNFCRYSKHNKELLVQYKI